MVGLSTAKGEIKMYHRKSSEDGEPYGSFEVFEIEPGEWWWWACFPGCLPDGEATGPFPTEAAAIADAVEGA